MGTIVSKDEIIKIVKSGRKNGMTFAATNGCFDIIHVGHIKYLQATKSLADFSIVMLNSDASVKILKGASRPINNEKDRAEVLTALSCVDYVVLFNEKSPAKLLEEIKPDIYTKGADYTLETLPERDIVIKNNIEVKFISFVEGKSTTSLIKKINS